MTFAHQAAVAIENARLYERGEQQIRQFTVLRDIDSAISSSFDLRVTSESSYQVRSQGTEYRCSSYTSLQFRSQISVTLRKHRVQR